MGPSIAKAMELRAEMRTISRALDPAARRVHLEKEMETAPDPLRRAFAAIIFVVDALELDFADGKRRLDRALGSLRSASRQNRLFGSLVRDTHVVLANLQLRYGKDRAAELIFRQAALEEKDPTRRAHLQLNLARIAYRRGDLAEALRISSRLRGKMFDDTRISQYFTIMRARILLTLGYEADAGVALADAEQASPPTRRIDLERRYVALYTTFDASSPAAFFKMSDELLHWLEAGNERAEHAFYAAEFETLRLALSASGNRQRLNSHARAGSNREAEHVGGLVSRVLGSKAVDATAFPELRVALREISASNNHQWYGAIAQAVALTLARSKRATLRVKVLDDLAGYLNRLDAGLPMSTLAKLRSRPSRLRSACSEAQADDMAGELWLLGGAPS